MLGLQRRECRSPCRSLSDLRRQRLRLHRRLLGRDRNRTAAAISHEMIKEMIRGFG